MTLAGRPAPLTPTDYDLRGELSLEAGRVITHERLLRRVLASGQPGQHRHMRAAHPPHAKVAVVLRVVLYG